MQSMYAVKYEVERSINVHDTREENSGEPKGSRAKETQNSPNNKKKRRKREGEIMKML